MTVNIVKLFKSYLLIFNTRFEVFMTFRLNKLSLVCILMTKIPHQKPMSYRNFVVWRLLYAVIKHSVWILQVT